jgi:hypothetical protein
MRKTQSLKMRKISLLLIVLSASLSCSTVAYLPSIEDRKLRFHPDQPALFYQWKECVKKVLGICTKKEMKREFYDLTDPAVRRRIIDMGFTATSERRWQH